jgi:sodium/proline symporter
VIAKYVILFGYFVALFLIGYFASRRVRNISDYYVGGKKLSYWVVAFSTRATGESAWLLLGLTGLGAVVGVSAFWVVVGEVLGVGLSWFVMAKPFKKLSDKYGSITIPDYLVSHVGAKKHTLRIIAAVALSVFVVIYVSAQIDATGTAFEAFLDWNYFVGALVGFGIVVAYILFGGFIAVAWSDVFQGLLMFLGLVILPVVVVMTMDNAGGVLAGLEAIDPSLLNFWGEGGFSAINVATALGYCLIGLGFLGSPQLFVRFMSIKSVSEINNGRWVALTYTLLTDLAAVSIGLLGRYLFTSQGMDVQEVLGNNGQNVLIQLVETTMPWFVTGLYIAVVLAAIMSTIDSLLVVASSAVVRDVYQQILHPDISIEKLTRLSRWVTFGMALVALTIAMIVAVTNPERTIFWFVIFGWSGLAATFCPVMILTLFYKKLSERGAIASMITGFLCVPLFKFVVPAIDGIGVYFSALAELGPSFVLALIMGIALSGASSKSTVGD